MLCGVLDLAAAPGLPPDVLLSMPGMLCGRIDPLVVPWTLPNAVLPGPLKLTTAKPSVESCELAGSGPEPWLAPPDVLAPPASKLSAPLLPPDAPAPPASEVPVPLVSATPPPFAAPGRLLLLEVFFFLWELLPLPAELLIVHPMSEALAPPAAGSTCWPHTCTAQLRPPLAQVQNEHCT